ncbi:MAG: class I SAM-dependent methyltransferase [Gemmatimonadota bacterium]|nr:class I SAM-dependent methyltransferase [Gemmatimonadota bacterium]
MTDNQTQDKPAERRFYDDLFRRRGRFDQFNDSVYERIALEARTHARGDRLLELGCGSGAQAHHLLRAGFSVVALDLSSEAVSLARRSVIERGGRLPAINADAEHLPIGSATVDVCICGLLLHHFRSLELVASEIRRVLRPGGLLVAIDANAHQPFAWLFLNVLHRLKPRPGMTPNQRALRSSEIVDVFGRRGFRDFRFSSITSKLRRDWLGTSLASTMNYYSRASVLELSRILLPEISQGNMLISVCRLGGDDAEPPPGSTYL